MTEPDLRFEGEPLRIPVDRRTVVELPPRVFRARLVGMLFETDKAFLLPSAMHGIRGLRLYYEQQPRLSVLVTGHSDTVGGDAYNEGLSEERAAAVAAYLVEDVDAWLQHYAGTPHSRQWGTAEDQHMLSVLPDDQAPYYAGEVSGINDGATQTAVMKFQQDEGLVVDGIAGPNTRRALVTRYMALDGTTLPEEATLVTHGCGEHHPAVATADGVDEAANRRVEIFLFEGAVDPPPRSPCSDCPEYPQWLAKVIETVDFTTEPGWLDIAVIDDQGAAVAEAGVRVEGIVATQQTTGAAGTVRFLDLPPGSFRVVVVAAGFGDVTFPAQVVPGVPPPEPPAPPPVAETPDHSLALVDAAPDGEGGGGGGGQGGVQPGSSIGGQFAPNTGVAKLSKTDTVVRVVAEIPVGGPPKGLTDRAKEGVANHGLPPWDRAGVTAFWQIAPQKSRRTSTGLDIKGEAVFPFDPSGKTVGSAPVKQGVLQAVTSGPVATGPRAFGVHSVSYTMRDPNNHSTILVDPPIAAGTVTEVAISTRVRVSIWSRSALITSANVAGSTGVVDDLSMLTTLHNGPFTAGDDPASLGVEWDETFRPGANADHAKEVAFYSKCIADCHAKGVQCLVAFQHAQKTKRSPDFHRWMKAVNELKNKGKSSKAQAAIDNFAKKLVTFVFGDASSKGNLAKADGITFDIEEVISDPKQMPVAEQAEFFTAFYRSVADHLVPHRKFVGIAAGQFDNQVISIKVGKEKGLQARNDHGSTMVFARVTPYRMALGHPNIIIRPMAFGSLSSQKGAAAQQQWHLDIVEYALGTVGLPPAQFQLGVDLGHIGASSGAMNQRCEELLRPNRLGIILFGLGATHNWPGTTNVNTKINPDEKPSNTPGQPMQAPLP